MKQNQIKLTFKMAISGLFMLFIAVLTSIVTVMGAEPVYGAPGNLPVEVSYDYDSAFEILTLVNEERAKVNLGELKMDRELLDAAMLRAAELSVYFSHTRPNGLDCFSLCSHKMYGENAACGQDTVQQAMESWMNSDGHRENILTAGYRSVGIGAVAVDGTRYWIQCFGMSPAEEAASVHYQNKAELTNIELIMQTDGMEFRVTAEGSASLTVGEKGKVQMYINNTYRTHPVDVKFVSFLSSAPEICTVSENGELQGTGVGNAEITLSLKNSPDIKTSFQVTVSEKEEPAYKEGWIKKGSKYYWQNSDGSIRTKQGLFTVGKDKYYITKGGSRLSKSFKKIKGQYYYFLGNGKMFVQNKFYTINGKRYYFYADGHIATGRTKIGKVYYYFDSKGRQVKNVKAIKIGKSYYSIDSKGVTAKMSDKRAECIFAAQRFIAKHSTSSQTNAQKFRASFKYLLGYMRYSPNYFSTSADYKIIDKKDGIYELALSTFNAPNLRGNCHRFASCVAAMASVLGYKNPTVVTTTGDHSFVMIDGKYYDNMYRGLFGASSRPSYKIYKKSVF